MNDDIARWLRDVATQLLNGRIKGEDIEAAKLFEAAIEIENQRIEIEQLNHVIAGYADAAGKTG